MAGSDKLSIIADCLLLKGQNVVTVADDGSQEWNVCSAAYEHGVAHLIQEHDWKFGREFAVLTRGGDSDVPGYEDYYGKPTSCLHLIAIYVDDVPTTDYRVVGSNIHIVADTTYEIKAQYVVEPEPQDWPPMFISAVKEWVYAAIESGLKKDQRTADGHMAKADAFLQRARTRTDQEEQKRALFRGSLNVRRRERRG